MSAKFSRRPLAWRSRFEHHEERFRNPIRQTINQEKAMSRIRASRSFSHFPLAIAALLCAAQNVHADTIYFADIFNPDPSFGSIKKVQDDGKNLQPVFDTGGGLVSIALDLVNGKIYWCDVITPAIKRVNLDGTGGEDLVTADELPPGAFQFPSAIAVDPAGGKIYWGDQLSSQLWRANLDGSAPQLLRQTAFHRGIALDPVNGKVYWSTSDTFEKGEILRCNLSGTGLENVVTSADAQFKPSAIALDIPGGKVYWTDYVVDVVRRANLNGTNIQTIYPVGVNLNPRGIALDLKQGKVYFGQDIDFKLPLGKIVKMDLDGAFPEDLLAGQVGLVNYLALAPDPVIDCPADIAPAPGGNGQVDADDLTAVILAWGPCANPDDCPADIAPPGGNDVVDADDLVAVVLAWGPCVQ
jgi:hypothetical protein